MVRFPIFTFVLFTIISMIIAKSQLKFPENYHNRHFRNSEPARNLRNLFGKLIDLDTNAVYEIDGQKETGSSISSDTTTAETLLFAIPPKYDEIACLSACHACTEAIPIENHKKKSTENCGPMCNCADSCFSMSPEEVAKLYGENSNNQQDNGCWWKTYYEALNNVAPSSA